MGAEFLYAMVFTLWLYGDERAPYAIYYDRQLMTFKQCDQITDLLVPLMMKRFNKKYPTLNGQAVIKVGCRTAGVEL